MSKLILISGPPGVGKSTLARALSREIGAVLLDKDGIDESFSPQDRGERYRREVEPRVLHALLSLARLNLEVGSTVILDAPWTLIILNDPRWGKRIQELAVTAVCDLRVLECRIPEEMLRKRIADRGLKRDEVKLTEEGWLSFKKHDRIGASFPFEHDVIDLTRDPSFCLNIALKYLSEEETS